MSSKRKSKPVLTKRRAARYAAVQALFQAENAGQPMPGVIAEFDAHRLGSILSTIEDSPLASPEVDREWFKTVAAGGWDRREEWDRVLGDCLKRGWSLQRCGFLLRACLRAGAFELSERTDVPVPTVIHEYVEVSRLFLSPDEAGFVNAVLDKAAMTLRPSTTAL